MCIRDRSLLRGWNLLRARKRRGIRGVGQAERARGAGAAVGAAVRRTRGRAHAGPRETTTVITLSPIRADRVRRARRRWGGGALRGEHRAERERGVCGARGARARGAVRAGGVHQIARMQRIRSDAHDHSVCAGGSLLHFLWQHVSETANLKSLGPVNSKQDCHV